jgi:hypothetical protein
MPDPTVPKQVKKITWLNQGEVVTLMEDQRGHPMLWVKLTDIRGNRVAIEVGCIDQWKPATPGQPAAAAQPKV